MRALATLLLSALLATPVASQGTQTNRRAQPDSANAIPPYPSMLYDAMIGGTVRATFVVDTSGRPNMSSFKIRASDNHLFSTAVKNAIQRWRFSPARCAGRVAIDSVEQVVEFVPPPAQAFLLTPSTALARESLGDGRWRLVLGVPPISASMRPAADSIHLAIASAALDTLLSTLPVDSMYPPRIACIALGMTGSLVQPPVSMLRALSSRNYTAVSALRCPKTFGSPWKVLRADGSGPEPDPPGEDPWAFTPRVPQSVDDSTAIIDITMSHATTSGVYHCYARRDQQRARGWRAVCRAGRMAVH